MLFSAVQYVFHPDTTGIVVVGVVQFLLIIVRKESFNDTYLCIKSTRCIYLRGADNRLQRSKLSRDKKVR